MAKVTLTKARQPSEYPRLLHEIADDLEADVPRAALRLRAEELRELAADLEALAMAYRAASGPGVR